MNAQSVYILAASEAAGHPFKHEESARLWLATLPKDDQEFHLKRARAKVYLRSAHQHSKLMAKAVWDKAFARA